MYKFRGGGWWRPNNPGESLWERIEEGNEVLSLPPGKVIANELFCYHRLSVEEYSRGVN